MTQQDSVSAEEKAQEIVEGFGAVFSFPAFVTAANGYDQKKDLLYAGRWENGTLIEMIATALARERQAGREEQWLLDVKSVGGYAD